MGFNVGSHDNIYKFYYHDEGNNIKYNIKYYIKYNIKYYIKYNIKYFIKYNIKYYIKYNAFGYMVCRMHTVTTI